MSDKSGLTCKDFKIGDYVYYTTNGVIKRYGLIQFIKGHQIWGNWRDTLEGIYRMPLLKIPKNGSIYGRGLGWCPADEVFLLKVTDWQARIERDKNGR